MGKLKILKLSIFIFFKFLILNKITNVLPRKKKNIKNKKYFIRKKRKFATKSINNIVSGPLLF